MAAVNIILPSNVNDVNMSLDKPRYHHGDLAAALVAAAIEMVAAEGAGALSLREAAKRAGVSAAAVYRHFPDKDGLMAAVAAEGFARLNAAFAVAVQGGAPVDCFRALGVAYAVFAESHSGLFRVMFGAGRPASERDTRLAAESQRAFRFLLDAVAACCPAGTGAAAIMAAAVAAWSLVHGYAQLRLDRQLDEVPLDIQAVLDGLPLIVSRTEPLRPA